MGSRVSSLTPVYSFKGRLQFSRGIREESDLETLKRWIDGCVSVVKTDTEQDKAGVDYIATLRNGAKVLIDAKAREAGCSKYWRNGPELALEKWSVVPGEKFATPRHAAKTGWTLCEAKQTDLILFTFDSCDTDEAFLIPFQHLRMAYRRHLREWHRRYREAFQHSHDSGRLWQSQCVFVPASVVLDACAEVSRAVVIEQRFDLRPGDELAQLLLFPVLPAPREFPE